MHCTVRYYQDRNRTPVPGLLDQTGYWEIQADHSTWEIGSAGPSGWLVLGDTGYWETGSGPHKYLVVNEQVYIGVTPSLLYQIAPLVTHGRPLVVRYA